MAKKRAAKQRPVVRDPESLSETLRQALAEAETAGWTLLAISIATQIPYPTLHEFARGRHRDGERTYGKISAETIDRLLAFFRMRTTKARIPKPTRSSVDRRFSDSDSKK